MLKKANRLTRKEFDTYFKSGKRVHSPVLTLVYTPHDELHGSVVVGKKVAKLAVRRNTLRRRIYEQLRRFAKQSDATGIFILITKPQFNSLTKEHAREAVEELLLKVRH